MARKHAFQPRAKKRGKDDSVRHETPGAFGRSLRSPVEVAAEALRAARASALWPGAVALVRGLFDAKPGSAEDVRRQWREDPTGWWAPHHLRSGMALRNRLRDAGFGEAEFGIGNLDDVYVALIEEAADVRGST